MAISQQDYWLKPGESIAAYNARIATLRAAETPAPAPAPAAHTPAPVTILVGGKPTKVNEIRPGLFGELGYKYSGAPPVAPPVTPPALTEAERAKEIEETKAKLKEKEEEAKKVLGQVTELGVEIPGAEKLAKMVGVELPGFPETGAPKTGDYAKGLLEEYEKKKGEYGKRLQEQLDTITKKREAAEKEIENIRTTQAGLLEKDIEPLLRPWREDLEKSERKRLSVEENYFANQRSVDELDKLLTQMRDEVAAAEEITGLRAIRKPRIQKLKEDLKGRIGVIEAVMATRNQQINVAYSLIDRMANAIEADRKNRLTYYETMYKFYQTTRDEEGKKLFELTKEERDWTEAQIKLIKDDMDTAKGTVDYVKSLMLTPKTADLIEKAGIKLTDSIEEINVKLADATYQEDIIGTIDKMALQGYKYLPLESQWRIKPEEELIRIYDSRGKEMVFWREKGIEKGIKKGITKLTDDDRMNEITNFLEPRRGTDGYVSSGSYQEALNRWIRLGGATSKFFWAFPVTEWVSKGEWKNLQPKLRPKVSKEEAIKDLWGDFETVKNRLGITNRKKLHKKLEKIGGGMKETLYKEYEGELSPDEIDTQWRNYLFNF